MRAGTRVPLSGLTSPGTACPAIQKTRPPKDWAPTPMSSCDSSARILWRVGRQQSAAPTCASATICTAFLSSGDTRLRVGREKGKETSDLIKALAGGAHWREPADATWSRLSSRAGLPTATTEDTLTEVGVRSSRAWIEQAFSAPSRVGSCVCVGALRGESPTEAEETRASGLGFRCPCLRVRTGAPLGPCPPHPTLGRWQGGEFSPRRGC